MLPKQCRADSEQAKTAQGRDRGESRRHVGPAERTRWKTRRVDWGLRRAIHELPDSGQDPRHLGTVEPLWTLFDLTSAGRLAGDEQMAYPCCHGPCDDSRNTTWLTSVETFAAAAKLRMRECGSGRGARRAPTRHLLTRRPMPGRWMAETLTDGRVASCGEEGDQGGVDERRAARTRAPRFPPRGLYRSGGAAPARRT
jgi:hypothetical protein